MSESAVLNIFTPDPVPNEFSNSILTILESPPSDHEIIKQHVYSLATRTVDPMLQYLCSGASYFPDYSLGYVALIASLVPLDFKTHVEHLHKLIDILPSIFDKAIKALQRFLDSKNFDIPANIQDLLRDLPNPVKKIKHTIQYLVVYYNIDQFVTEQKDVYTQNLLNVVRITISWLSAIASYLRLNTLSLASQTTEALEKQRLLDAQLIPNIQSSFGVINTFSPSAVDITHYQSLLQSSAVIITTLSSYVDRLIQQEDSEMPTHIVKFKEEAMSSMNLLESAFTHLRGIPDTVIQQDSSIFIQSLFMYVDNFTKTLADQPQMFLTLQSDLRIQAFNAFLLIEALNATDVNSLKKLFSQLYRLDNLTEINQKASEIQESMQTVNQAIYGFTSKPSGERRASKSNIVKQTTIEEVQIIKTVTEKHTASKTATTQIQVPKTPEELLKPQTPVIGAPREIDHSYCTLDFHNTQMLTNALGEIGCIEARESTIEDINEFLNDRQYASHRSVLEENVRKVLVMRAENKYITDLNVITNMNENECYEKSLEIATVLPVFAGSEHKSIHKLSLPLFIRESPADVYKCVRLLLVHLTYIIPLRQRVDSIAGFVLKERRSVDAEIESTANTFKIPLIKYADSNDRENEIFNLANFLSYAEIMQTQQFTDSNAKKWIETLHTKLSMEQTRDIANDMVCSCIATATIKNCFDVSVMRSCRSALEEVNNYLTTKTEQSKLRLIGSLCLLPVSFQAVGQMDADWASAIALITPTNLNKLISIGSSSLTNYLIYAYSVQTSANQGSLENALDESSSSDDDEPEIIYEDIIEEEEVGEPETIEDVEEITIEEEEDEPEEDDETIQQIRQARKLESVRNALHLLKSFNDAAMNLEPALVNTRFESFYLCMYDLSKLVSPQETEQINQILQTITAIAKQIVGYNDRSGVSQIETGIDYLRQLKNSLTGKSSTGSVISELVLFCNYADQLWNRIEFDPNEVQIEKFDKFKQQVIKESSDVLKLMRQLGRRSIKLIQQLNDISHSKPLTKAISQAAESAQLFYLYIRNAEHDDDLNAMVSNGCRKMASALSCMVMLIPKTLPDDYNDVRGISQDITSHLEYMIDLAEQKTGGAVQGKGAHDAATVELGSNLTEKRLDAEALVIKRRKEFADAEAELQRLNNS